MMSFAEPQHCKPSVFRALIITNSPDQLRSQSLYEFHNSSKWIESNVCLGIPRSDSREELEVDIAIAGLPKPPNHVFEVLSLSEVGCIYAHLKALTIASESNGLTLILEDDAEFDSDNLQQILSNLDWLPDDAIIKLEGYAKDGRESFLGLILSIQILLCL